MKSSDSNTSPEKRQLSIWESPENPFERIKHIDEQRQEHWLARELMVALEYTEWRNFAKTVEKGRIALETAGHNPAYHFVGVNKMIETARGANRKIVDFKLSRLGCYFVADNGDSSKSAVALAQNYFMIQTRRQELSEEQQRLKSQKDINAYRLRGFSEDVATMRIESKESQKKAGGVAIGTHETHTPDFAAIGAAQNKGLFDMTRQQIVDYLGLLPKDEGSYRDHLGYYALMAVKEANHTAAKRMKLAGRPLTSLEQVDIVKAVVRILAPTMRELAEFAGQDYLSGVDLDEHGRALITRNVRLLPPG